MFLKEWKSKGIVGENYNGMTGKAAEKGNSDKFYHWGALFAYMAIQTVFNLNVWNDEVDRQERPEWMEPVAGIAFRDGKINIE